MNSDPNEYRTWELLWTPVHVRRFWAWMAENSSTVDGQYFSQQVGDDLLNHVSQKIPLSGTVIDWGAGVGFLVEEPLRRGLDTFAVDASPNSIETLRRRIGEHSHLLGAATTEELSRYPRLQADLVFLVETVEHLDDLALNETLSNIRQFLRPGGHLAVTTPNDENLDKSKLACPNCGCVFHRVQHVRSFQPSTLQRVMAAHGFEAISCRPIRLSGWPKPLRPLNRLVHTLRGRKLPHLVFIGRHSASVNAATEFPPEIL